MCARDDRDQLVVCPALHLHLPGRLLDGKPSFNALPAGLTKHTRWRSCTPLAGCEAQWQVVLSTARSLRPTHWYAQWMTMTRCADVSIGLPVRGRGSSLVLPSHSVVEADAGEVDPAPCLRLQWGEASSIPSDLFCWWQWSRRKCERA